MNFYFLLARISFSTNRRVSGDLRGNANHVAPWWSGRLSISRDHFYQIYLHRQNQSSRCGWSVVVYIHVQSFICRFNIRIVVHWIVFIEFVVYFIIPECWYTDKCEIKYDVSSCPVVWTESLSLSKVSIIMACYFLAPVSLTHPILYMKCSCIHLSSYIA